MLKSSGKLSTCDQWNPFVVKPSSSIGCQAQSSEIGYRSVSWIRNCMDFSYFGQRVRFLLAPSASKKWALSVAAFSVLLSVSLETYILYEVGQIVRLRSIFSSICVATVKHTSRYFDLMLKQEKNSTTKTLGIPQLYLFFLYQSVMPESHPAQYQFTDTGTP